MTAHNREDPEARDTNKLPADDNPVALVAPDEIELRLRLHKTRRSFWARTNWMKRTKSAKRNNEEVLEEEMTAGEMTPVEPKLKAAKKVGAMGIIITVLAIVFIILLGITIALAWLNWNEDTAIKLLTSFIGGLIVFISFFALGLRQESFRDGFMMFIPINKMTNAIDLGDVKSAERRHINYEKLSMLFFLGAQQINLQEKEKTRLITVFEKPETPSAIHAINEDVIQYFLIQQIESIQRASELNFVFQPTDGGLVVDPYRPVRPSDLDRIPPDIAFRALSQNPIVRNNPVEQDKWRNGTSVFHLPKGADVTLKAEPMSESTGVEKRRIIIYKPRFFTIEITIEVAGSNFQPLPVSLAYDDPGTINNHAYRITMEARFDRLTFFNGKRAEYKAWAQWLMGQIKNSAMIYLNKPNAEQ